MPQSYTPELQAVLCGGVTALMKDKTCRKCSDGKRTRALLQSVYYDADIHE